MEEHKPRRIRDIAHIYLSRLDRKFPEQPRRVVVAGTRRECFSGFHTANIAAAFSQRGCSVRVRDLSGLVPNAAYFLALPAAVHLAAADRETSEWYSALGGIALTFSSTSSETSHGKSPVVDLYHAPPGESADAHRSVVSQVATHKGAMFVTLDDGDPAGLTGDISYRVGALGQGSMVPAGTSIAKGRIERWGAAVSDPVPAVVRDPGSMLARCFSEICEQLLNPAVRPQTTEHDEKRVQRTRRTHRRRVGSAARAR
jgi:hypothetical protein